MNILLMANHCVGLEISRWLSNEYPEDIALAVTIEENDIFQSMRSASIPCIVFESADQVISILKSETKEPDLGILAWWPKIIKQPLLGVPKHGFINTHPSLLPYNRGKHYNFWALAEQAPFGVSLHFVDEGVDSGDIVAQMNIPYNWEDNGATLYKAAQAAMLQLFKITYPKIRALNIVGYKQDKTNGSFHLASEIEHASHIDLDQWYRARDLLNLLRARTFPGYPACWFSEAEQEYEIRIEIKRKQ